MTIYLTSDLHFGHRNIIDFCDRPFTTVTYGIHGVPIYEPDVEAMNEALIENWNSVVSVNDLVYVLGDVCMGKIDDSLALLPRLNGTKKLVPGNHDRCWVGNGSKHKKWISRYEEVGFPPTSERHLIHDGEFFFMDHFPYSGDSHTVDRYVEHRPIDKGSWLLCGHVHDSWKIQDRQINVGVDVWDYKPVSIDTLVQLKRERE